MRSLRSFTLTHRLVISTVHRHTCKFMNDNHPLPYSLAGRLLLVACILLPLCGTWGTMYLLADSLPSGSYPVLFFAIPYIALALLIFFGGCLLLRKAGIRVRRDDVVMPDGLVKPASTLNQRAQPDAEPTPTSESTAYCSVCKKDVEIDDDYRCVHCHWPT